MVALILCLVILVLLQTVRKQTALIEQLSRALTLALSTPDDDTADTPDTWLVKKGDYIQ